MDSGSRKGQASTAEDALMAEHDAELVALAQRYVNQVEAVQALRDKAIASIRTGASRALVELVARFEMERSAALARFAVKCAETRGSGREPELGSRATRKHKAGAN